MITKIKIILGIMTIVALGTWIISANLLAGSSSPGTVNDPLVTRSYVDQMVGNLKTEVMAKLEGLTTTTPTGTSTVPATTGLLFTVVEVEKGQKLICGASAEVILRAGSATVIQGANGDGLADLTAGDGLAGGDEVPLQHHLLVSRDDGRGLLVTSSTTSFILVKGDYTIQ